MFLGKLPAGALSGNSYPKNVSKFITKNLVHLNGKYLMVFVHTFAELSLQRVFVFVLKIFIFKQFFCKILYLFRVRIACRARLI